MYAYAYIYIQCIYICSLCIQCWRFKKQGSMMEKKNQCLQRPWPEERCLVFTVPKNQPYMYFCGQHIPNETIHAHFALHWAPSGDFWVLAQLSPVIPWTAGAFLSAHILVGSPDYLLSCTWHWNTSLTGETELDAGIHCYCPNFAVAKWNSRARQDHWVSVFFCYLIFV